MMNERIAQYKAAVETRLNRFFLYSDDNPLKGYGEAVRYSLLASGKRIRAMLVLEFCRISGGDPDSAMDIAASVEMLHAYSLIHDDLPCMDNDNLRRGKPTNHIVFGEGIATLAGDVLQAEAFRTILHSGLPASSRLRCAELLADAVGLEGMCGGQYLDLRGEGTVLSSEQLDAINLRKTAALLSASCAMGVSAAGGSAAQEEAAGSFGRDLGLAFQIRDDVLDVISSESELGKPIGSDAKENKNTYMALLGEKGCERLIDTLTARALSAIHEAFSNTAFLDEFANQMAIRRY